MLDLPKVVATLGDGDDMALHIYIEGNYVRVRYRGQRIWTERIEADSSFDFFGIESCDTISRIMACIDNGSPWDQYKHAESS